MIACGATTTPVPEPVTTLGGELRAAAHGQPILLRRDDGDVVAMTADHSLTKTLATGLDSPRDLYDPERELLWYVAHETLWVLDLRASGAPVPIAEHVTSDFTVDGAFDDDLSPQLTLAWTREPTLGDSGMRADLALESADDAAAIARAHLVGTSWLQHNVDRMKRAIAVASLDAVDHLGSDVDRAGRGECVGSVCGTGTVLGTTGLVLVVTESYRDHDGSHRACSLFDPKARRFVDERGNAHVKIRFHCQGELDRDTRQFLGCGVESDANGGLGSGEFACTREGCTVLERSGACAVRFLDPGARIHT